MPEVWHLAGVGRQLLVERQNVYAKPAALQALRHKSITEMFAKE